MMGLKLRAALLSLVASTLPGCTSRSWQARLFPPDAPELRQASPDRPFLKAHGKDGSVAVLERWSIDPAAGVLSGEGLAFDADRKLVGSGHLELRTETLALLETNRPETVMRGGVAFIGVALAGTALLGAYCLSNPKACFGSCPTIYADEGGRPRLVAEGFSASIARSLEATDVDALDLRGPHPAELVLTMRNEAEETHYVRSVRLLAVPRPAGGRIYRAGDRFLPAGREAPPLRCAGADGDCLAQVSVADGAEYRSLAGASDLAEEERIELAFPAPKGPAGLVIRARNSLLNTFVFYQGLAWLGTRAGEVFARLDAMAPDETPPFTEWARLLGRARVEVLSRDGWREVGNFGEVGPIAWETEIVPLPADLPEGELRVRLRLTRGNWKIDRLAIAELVGPAVQPVPIPVAEVRRDGAADPSARARLRGEGARLVSVPRDAWSLVFPLPEPLRDAELFLESRGYYHEWMRQSWLAEEDPGAAVALVRDPREALRRLAPAWKRLEPDAERVFWQSRIGEAR
jgi:hypothetical protein